MIGFTSTAGFPQVITQGAQYNLSGWIINHGPTAFTGTLGINLLADSNTVLSLDNNFNVSGLLQAGDSIYWSRSNYNFPPGHFRTGNNDVIIWPTTPSGGDFASDSIAMQIYFTSGSAFRQVNSGFEPFASGICLSCDYDLRLKAENMSAEANASSVCLYVQLPGRAARCVMQNAGTFAQYEVAEFSNHHFNIANEFNLLPGDSATIDHIEFFSKESALITEPMNRISLPVVVGTVGQTDPAVVAGFDAYPNPFAQSLTVEVPAAWRADAQVRLSDLAGRVVYASALTQATIDVGPIAAGSYILEVTSSKGMTHKQLLKR